MASSGKMLRRLCHCRMRMSNCFASSRLRPFGQQESIFRKEPVVLLPSPLGKVALIISSPSSSCNSRNFALAANILASSASFTSMFFVFSCILSTLLVPSRMMQLPASTNVFPLKSGRVLSGSSALSLRSTPEVINVLLMKSPAKSDPSLVINLVPTPNRADHTASMAPFPPSEKPSSCARSLRTTFPSTKVVVMRISKCASPRTTTSYLPPLRPKLGRLATCVGLLPGGGEGLMTALLSLTGAGETRPAARRFWWRHTAARDLPSDVFCQSSSSFITSRLICSPSSCTPRPALP